MRTVSAEPVAPFGTVASGKFFANAAWLAWAVLAHNFTRWTATIGEIKPDDQQFTVTRTIRTRIYAIPGRIVNRSGQSGSPGTQTLAVG